MNTIVLQTKVFTTISGVSEPTVGGYVTKYSREGFTSSMAELQDLLKSGPFWIIATVVIYLVVMMVLYPSVGFMLAAIGIIMVSNISHHPARVILTFLLICFLIWSARYIGPIVYVDDPVPDEEQAISGYGPTAGP